MSTTIPRSTVPHIHTQKEETVRAHSRQCCHNKADLPLSIPAEDAANCTPSCTLLIPLRSGHAPARRRRRPHAVITRGIVWHCSLVKAAQACSKRLGVLHPVAGLAAGIDEVGLGGAGQGLEVVPVETERSESTNVKCEAM